MKSGNRDQSLILMEAKRRADDRQQVIIDRRLDEYLEIKKVIGTNPDRYIISRDQYSGSIPPHLYDDIAVFSIGGILFWLIVN